MSRESSSFLLEKVNLCACPGNLFLLFFLVIDFRNVPLYFMTDDDVTKGLNQVCLTGQPYESTVQPNHLESVIVRLRTGENKTEEMWKFSRYIDNPQFWSDPGVEDIKSSQKGSPPISDTIQASVCFTTTKTQPVPDQFELYNLTNDPLEKINLAYSLHKTAESKVIQPLLTRILVEERRKKRLSPTSDNVSH